ncbi:MAG TPA: DegT/DnrJ/EryC1/StrS family aminotransferase [Longimicrobiales bacterium]|nr:DegT/DnrJ/EryC1/StrS family aminotransferase [Longimicrobiales bacterium]
MSSIEPRSIRQTFLPFAVPCLDQEEIDEVVDTLRSGWITTGPKTKQFEREFAAYIGAPAGLALNSCTAGLHVALRSLGIGPGDEVITTTNTFVASVNVIEHVGARPVLVDVEADTLNLDPYAVERALTPRTRAVLPVHFAGHPADLDAIRDVVGPDMLIVEDAAHALPARYKGRMIGSNGNPTAFSFYATKNLSTGEGGMLTGNPDFLEAAGVMALHGMSRDAWKRYGEGGSWFYEVVVPGFKYNMSDVQASLGLHQLRKLEGFQARRREIVERYNSAFVGSSALEIPTVRSDVEHAWHLYVLRLNLPALRIDRAAFIDELARRRIGTSVHFIPVHLHPFYRDRYEYRAEDFPVAFSTYQRTISLPLHPALSDDDVDSVIDAVLDTAVAFRR